MANLAFQYGVLITTLLGGLVLVPVYLSFLGLPTYGAWLASGNVVGLLSVLDMGIGLVLAQRLAVQAGAMDTTSFETSASTGLAATSAMALAIGTIALAASSVLPELIHAPRESHSALATAIRLSALGAVLGLFQQYLAAISQAWQEPYWPGAAALSGAIIGLTVPLILLHRGAGIEALGWGVLLRTAVGTTLNGVAVFAGWRSRDLRVFRPRLEDTKSLFRDLSPVFLGRASSAALTNSESLIVSVALGPVPAGILALTGRAAAMTSMILLPIGTAVFGGLARFSAERPPEEVERVVRQTLCIVSAAGGVLVGVAASLNPTFVRLWVGNDGFGGLAVSGATLVASALTVRSAIGNVLLTALGGAVDGARNVAIESAIRLALSISLVGALGIIGLPIAAGIASGISLSLMVSRSIRKRLGSSSQSPPRQPIAWTAWEMQMIPAAGGVAAGSLLRTLHTWPSLGLATLIVTVVFGGLVLGLGARATRGIQDLRVEWARSVMRGSRGRR